MGFSTILQILVYIKDHLREPPTIVCGSEDHIAEVGREEDVAMFLLVRLLRPIICLQQRHT